MPLQNMEHRTNGIHDPGHPYEVTRDDVQGRDECDQSGSIDEDTVYGTTSTGRVRKVYLRKVVQDAYEYHGLNELAFFFLFAVTINLVLYFHWGSTTAVFKTNVQEAFKGYGNPDWQWHELDNIGSMYDGIEYVTGFMEFYLNRSDEIYVQTADGQAFVNEATVRIEDYATIKYARFLVNLENNCKLSALDCYKDWAPIKNKTTNITNFMEDHNFETIDSMDFREVTKTGTQWFAYTVVAPILNATNATRADYIDRLYGITRATSLSQDGDDEGPDNLKSFLSLFSYAFVLDLLAINNLEEHSANTRTDAATFSMHVQRSDRPYKRTNRLMWTSTTTSPVRTYFYQNPGWDWLRLVFEVLLLLLLIVNTYLEIWNFRTVRRQHGNYRRYFTYWWNWIQSLSTLSVYVWLFFYLALLAQLYLAEKQWPVDETNEYGHKRMKDLEKFGNDYNIFMYGAIVINAVVCFRIVRYMRIHLGLKAFYQVFIIAAREFIDFAVFILYILLLLGASIFAFFQLSGGNYQFLRFGDGLSVMARLTFGFLDFEEFKNGALGLGTAFSAVTALFWFAVLLLVVYSQNIILVIVAEAYEEAKATLGVADTAFLMLICQRIIFTLLLLWMTIKKVLKCCCCCFNRPKPGSDREVDSLSEEGRLERRATSEGAGLHLVNGMHSDIYNGRLPSTAEPSDTAREPSSRRLTASRNDVSMQEKWGRFRWASWALVRTDGLSALVAMYMDYATLKLKPRPLWPKVEELARQIAGDDRHFLPDLADNDGLVDAKHLRTLFLTARMMGERREYRLESFEKLAHQDIELLVQRIMEVYGEDFEGSNKVPGDRGDSEDIDLPPAHDQNNKNERRISSGGVFGRRSNSFNANSQTMNHSFLRTILAEQRKLYQKMLREQRDNQLRTSQPNRTHSFSASRRDSRDYIPGIAEEPRKISSVGMSLWRKARHVQNLEPTGSAFSHGHNIGAIPICATCGSASAAAE